MEGTVFDIQHYSIHNGPGIRTTVFLKGCPLNCLWCQNPESISFAPELMHNAEKCVGCGRCESVCTASAVMLLKDNIDEDNSFQLTNIRKKCNACGTCVDVCLGKARSIAGKTITSEETYAIANKDRIFYSADGGVTLSGGEPLSQIEFAVTLLEIFKNNNINTCVDTCGYAEWESIQALMDYADLVLYDVKHMDTGQHKTGTSIGNELILENLARLSTELQKDIIIRVPVIPGYNDSANNMRELAEFITKSCHTCREVNLLPYHDMGKSKLQQLEKDFQFISRIPTETEMETLRQIIQSYGISVK